MYNNDNKSKHTQIYTTKFTKFFFIHNSSELSRLRETSPTVTV
jgi:hypothetical protein